MVGIEREAAGGSFYPMATSTPTSTSTPLSAHRPRSPRAAEEARRRRRRVYRRRRIALSVILAFVLVFVYVLWSFFGAVTTPGNQSFSAKWSDWLRSHHAAFIVNPIEQWYYSSKAPPKGGRPHGLNKLPSAASPPAPRARVVVAHLPSPPAVPLVVSPALPGEGRWQSVGPSVDGYPTMEVAQFRADTTYTSQITSAVWIDPLLTRVESVPGSQEPGGTWSHPPHVTAAELPKALAAFNGGFRFADAQGGYELDGHVAVPLHQGAASLVIYRNGRVDIGTWGTEVHQTPQVASVLQNLVPMVDHGQITHDASYTDASIWGNTLGAATIVARSGVGVTADGGLVYVAGPALSARTLAESLQRAGAVRAMTLDINPEWVTFNFFSHLSPSSPSTVSPAALYPQMQRPAYRYLPQGGAESRDFFLISQR